MVQKITPKLLILWIYYYFQGISEYASGTFSSELPFIKPIGAQLVLILYTKASRETEGRAFRALLFCFCIPLVLTTKKASPVAHAFYSTIVLQPI